MFENAPYIFLTANSADGFVNKFQSFTDKKENWYTYIIKGGPGTGKSSFMKKVANRATESSDEVVLCPCSSDTDSLDAVILTKQKIMVVDGTAPHTIDPICAGVSDEILNFGEFWNGEKLKEQGENIKKVSLENKLFHKRAALCISAAGRVKRDNMKISLIAADIEKVVNEAEKTANRFLNNGNQEASETVCYLNAVSPKGNVFYKSTIDYFANEKIIINDSLGTVSNIFMSIVRDIALAKKYNIITVKDNILPNDKIEHIIVPKAKIAFCSEGSFFTFEEKQRRIRAERFMDEMQIAKNSKRIKFNKKLEKEFIKQAIEALGTAKDLHDKLESYYINAMDFDKANRFCDSVIDEIFKT